ncbi:unnamed protein product [Didymodactylos carnosus]|uniref:Uncharacterized protein n=1 Tax=Didymodactylos carnosus TaxID=1234261 RepID=A0A816FFQ8_9BILA|nr:unnamed protein product [Didymodactylos carnosus]CAF4609151.1 unnamed protein product [Didymodactylos carnosus]
MSILRSKILPTTRIHQAYYEPFNPTVKCNIQTVMVAQIADGYFDANAGTYGVSIEVLRRLAKSHMMHLYENYNPNSGFKIGSPHSNGLSTACCLMNQMQIYVDCYALNYWLQQGGNMTTFQSSRLAVYQMFSNLIDKIDTWVDELKRSD